MSTRVPDLLVERLARGELPPERAADVRARLASEPGGLARLDALAASDAAIKAALPPDRVAREVRARVAQADAGLDRSARWWVVAPLVVAAVAALLVVVPPAGPGHDAPGVRLKGHEPALLLYRKRGAETALLGAAERARPGDLLQLTYVAGGASHGVILSVDGRGAVTLHFPAEVSASTALDGAGEVPLAHAYELDDAPAHETFLFLASDAPIDVSTALVEARGEGTRARFVDVQGKVLTPYVRRVEKEAAR